MQELYEICREKKDTANHRITNQDLADATGKSLNTVAQYLRGEAPNASFETVSALCKELDVSMDAFSGIEGTTDAQLRLLTEKLIQAEADKTALQAELKNAKAQLDIYKKSIKEHRKITWMLLALVMLAVAALIVDLLDPNVGWIRAALGIEMQWFHL